MMKSLKNKVLLIEDDPGDADMIIRALQKEDESLELIHLEDGADALDFILNQDKLSPDELSPRMIILDLSMPKVSGMDVLETLRENSGTKNIPVVVFTSSEEESDLSKCYDLGVNSYIVKPVEYKEFKDTVKKIGRYWLETNSNA